MQRKSATLQSRVSSYDQFFDLIAQQAIPGLHRLVRTAVSQKIGIGTICSRMEMAIQGRYHAVNYSQEEMDLAVLTYELGGAAVVHALHKAFTSFPSVSTVRDSRRKRVLYPTSGSSLEKNIATNIHTLFGDKPARKVTHCLSADEININKKLTYSDHSDEVIGVCKEHVDAVGSTVMGDDLQLIETLTRAIRVGDVHIGKEALVFAISAHSSHGYSAKPISIAATCKQGTAEAVVLLYEMIIRIWKYHPDGEARHGPLTHAASDGDGVRRKAFYILFMRFKIGPDDAIFAFLGSLRGLNLYVGIYFMTMDFDFKHLFKRTSINNTAGCALTLV